MKHKTTAVCQVIIPDPRPHEEQNAFDHLNHLDDDEELQFTIIGLPQRDGSTAVGRGRGAQGGGDKSVGSWDGNGKRGMLWVNIFLSPLLFIMFLGA